MKQGCVIAPNLFSVCLAALLSQAKIDLAMGVDIIYRSNDALFKLSRLSAKSKVKTVITVDLQYADDCDVFSHLAQYLENKLDAFVEAYELFGITVNATKTTV